MLSGDPRTDEVCGDCMYMRIDEEGTCWKYCHGKFNPRGKKENDEGQISAKFLSWLCGGRKNEKHI